MSKFSKTSVALIFFVAPACSAYAQATTTADLAKNCREQAIKAYPTPKAGTKSKGVAKAQRDFIESCMSKGADKQQKN